MQYFLFFLYLIATFQKSLYRARKAKTCFDSFTSPLYDSYEGPIHYKVAFAFSLNVSIILIANRFLIFMHQSFVAPAPSGPRTSGAFNFSIFKALLKALHCRAKFVVKSPSKAPAPGADKLKLRTTTDLNHLNKFSPLSRGGPT